MCKEVADAKRISVAGGRGRRGSGGRRGSARRRGQPGTECRLRVLVVSVTVRSSAVSAASGAYSSLDRHAIPIHRQGASWFQWLSVTTP